MRSNRKNWRPKMKDLENLLQQGKIRGFVVSKPKKDKPRIPGSRLSREKSWIALNIRYWCSARGLQVIQEFRFEKTRQWRFDWAIPSLKIAVEYEGIVSASSRHTTITGYTRDTEKYNRAQALGWIVLRFTALNYTTMTAELDQSLINR